MILIKNNIYSLYIFINQMIGVALLTNMFYVSLSFLRKDIMIIIVFSILVDLWMWLLLKGIYKILNVSQDDWRSLEPLPSFLTGLFNIIIIVISSFLDACISELVEFMKPCILNIIYSHLYIPLCFIIIAIIIIIVMLYRAVKEQCKEVGKN